ncbi:glycosyltransferase family 4 protein [Alteromonas sp. C1M14]|uniref:glycosyltransferase family 4 protein n=1 Tax=Alteromonas sp. C1M14 TaxID=2841567 RepID=UPI001C0938D5|nr:glycosyltransferase family 4 protein [Alteromonas sp. C1M14]MBU2979204.1 glycosyltransferase family 4 protein [Alteromonas sp. C1M14]
MPKSTKPPVILHCVSSLQVGGAEKCAVNLALAQQQAGYSVAVLSFGQTTDPFYQTLSSQGITVHCIAGNMVQRSIQVKQCFARYSFIHIHSPAVIRAIAPLALFIRHKHIIYTMHGEHSAKLSGMKLAHSLANLYLNAKYAVSKRVQEGVEQRYGWPVSEVKVISNGIMIPPRPLQDNVELPSPFRFGMVARLVPLKQVDQVIEVFSTLTKSMAIALHIFGDGPEKEKLQGLISSHQLDAHITMHGNELDEDKIYAQFDCLIINSNTEGLPMVLLEAMARALPVISTRVGAIPDIVEQGNTGLLIDSGDNSQLTTAIKTLLKNPTLYRQYADNAYDYVQQHYSVASISDTYLASYFHQE